MRRAWSFCLCPSGLCVPMTSPDRMPLLPICLWSSPDTHRSSSWTLDPLNLISTCSTDVTQPAPMIHVSLSSPYPSEGARVIPILPVPPRKQEKTHR